MNRSTHPGQYDWMRVLILGSTSVSYSRRYGATNCTGGLVEGSMDLVRIFPVPRVRLSYEQRFRAWQWVRLRATKAHDDPRPESFRIDYDSIQPEEAIPTTRAGHAQRRQLLEQSGHNCQSLEHLMDRNREEGISLGIVRPKEIVRCRLRRKPASERREWEDEEREILAQREFPFDVPVMRIDYTDMEFLVEFVCDDPRCSQPHEHRVQDWGIHELYRRLHDDPERDEKVVAQMQRMLDLNRCDVFFYFGSLRGHMTNFGLMGSYSCPKTAVVQRAQGHLFE